MNRTIYTVLGLMLPILAGGCAQVEGIVDYGGRAIDLLSGETALRDARMMYDTDFPDQRRKGINNLVRRHYGGEDVYISAYRAIARTDEDWLVRATAIRALNRVRDENSRELFVESLGHENPQIRLEAAKALANLPDDAAIPGL